MAVNLSALAGAGQQFFDNSGVILSGGKLYSYAAGTTTPQTTYTSAAGNTAHTNPIVLNSAGRVATGEIWLTAGSNYKFALYTSADVLITTWDNITGINGTGITSNAANVTYDPAGTGAVATTVQAKLREFVSVLDFGADPSGVADSTTAIRNAYAYANSVRRFGNSGVYGAGNFYVGCGPTVFFPSGVYKVTDYITPDTTGEVNYLRFEGENSIIVASAGVTVFGGVAYMVTFSGLTFRDGACAISIKTGNADACTFDINNCEFHEQTAAMIRTDATSQSTLVSVTKCKFVQTIVSSAYIFRFLSGDEIYVTDCWMQANAQNQAVIYNASGHLHMTNILGVPSSPMTTTGRWVDNYSSIYCKDVRFGGEYGGAPIIFNYTNLKSITTFPWIYESVVLENCNISCNLTSNRADAAVMVAKTGLPAVFRITGCFSKVDAPFIFDAMPAEVGVTLAAYLASYTTSGTTYPTLSVNITNNNCRGYLLTSDPVATIALQAYTTFEIANQTGNKNLYANASIQVAGNITTSSGYTASLGSGGTANIVTTPNTSFYLVSACGDTTTTQYAQAICYTNGSGTVTVTSIVATGISITSSGANTITVTNSSTTQQIRWAVLQTQNL